MTTSERATPVLRDADGNFYILTEEILSQAQASNPGDVSGFGLPVGGFSLGVLGYEGQPGNQGGKPGQQGKPPGLRGYEGQPGHQGGSQHNP